VQLRTGVFNQPYRFRTLQPGEKVIIWEEPITGDYLGFIDNIGNNWFPYTYIDFIVDGELIERIQKVTGELEGYAFQTRPVNPPIVAKKFIRWIAVNQDVDAHVFEVYCGGYYAKPKPQET